MKIRLVGSVVVTAALMAALASPTGEAEKADLPRAPEVPATPGGAPDADPARVNAIWNRMIDRFNVQNDRWFEDGDFPRNIQLLRVMNGLFPDDWEVATNLGWLLESTENDAEALSVYVRFRLENPTYADATFPEANFYFRHRAYAKVPALIEPSLNLKPHANSFRILAHSYERLGMLADSRRVWEAYIKLNPNDDPAKNNLRRVMGKIERDEVQPRRPTTSPDTSSNPPDRRTPEPTTTKPPAGPGL